MSGDSKKDSGDDKGDKGGGSGGGLAKIGAFWQKVVTKAKVMTGDKTALAQEQLSELGPEERTRLAAQLATAQLGLDTATQEQVAKAIEAEMERRRKEREKRRKELMASTEVQLPWGQKKRSPEAAVASSKFAAKPEQPKAKHVPHPSLGASIYPIKFEFVKDAKGGKVPGKLAAEANPWTDSSWKPVAAGPIGPSLEEKRKEWLAKNTQREAGSRKAMAPKSVSTKANSPSASLSDRPGEKGGTSAAVFGSQPTALQMDEEAVKEIHAHTLGMMLQNILVQASEQGKGKGKAGAQRAKSVKSPSARPSKKPGDMTVEELVDLLRDDPNAWDQYTTANTVISFGVVTPTSEDEEKGKKTKEAKREKKVTFDDEIDVAKGPVGKDFKFNERCDRSKGTLKK